MSVTATVTDPTVSYTYSVSNSFELTVKNPCVSTSINVPDDYHVDYYVNSDAKTVDYSYDFSIDASEEVAALCGKIIYTATLDPNPSGPILPPGTIVD